MERTGKCLCGAVTFTADVGPDLSACHCGMCRRWAGGPFFGVTAKNLRWTGEDKIRVFTSSPWAERAFCTECGSNLFYRMTAEGPHQGATSVALGLLEDQTDFELAREWFIDKKPDAYTLEGDRKKVTEAEVMAMFAPPE